MTVYLRLGIGYDQKVLCASSTPKQKDRKKTNEMVKLKYYLLCDRKTKKTPKKILSNLLVFHFFFCFFDLETFSRIFV